MGKGLCIFGMVGSALLILLFGLDLALGIPFGRVSVVMDIGFIAASLLLGVAGFLTFREIP
ncbi:MAG: hypothetical protein H5U08_04230 [Thermogutta sp.]|uniref:hypothetical protein n=1 Tax=Thermogutta sp. TaxID=1962930 RepID=UPI0019CAC29E|nr:hypothetical protein [Thermogutta sp.]MBC7351546.1 hypothetical protein [Thermogutta sp.]